MSPRELPLAGIKVVEFCHVAAGPFCGMLLADFGAEVVKVEPPEGDTLRQWPPITHGFSENFASLNRGKRSIALDLKRPEDLAVARRLVLEADVLIENNRGGAMARLGLGWDWVREHKPSAIYCSISAYGQTGPRSAEGGFDLTMQAAAGVMSVTGEPVKCGVPISDFTAGLYATYSITAALAQLRRAGPDACGCRIDVPMFATTLAVSALQTSEYFGTGRNPKPLGSTHPRNAPYQAFRCADGWFAIAAGNDKLWRSVCEVTGTRHLVDDARFASPTLRAANQLALRELLKAVFATAGPSEWVERFATAGVPSAPINQYADALDDRQAAHLQLVQPMTLPNGVVTRTVGCPVRFDGQAVAVDTHPPALDQHGAWLRENGHGWDRTPAPEARVMIALERRGGTARLTLQRADRGNALSAGLVESLIAAFEDCMADAGLHTLIIDADGPDFCTGFDLGGLGERPDEADDAALLGRFVRVEHLLSILWHAPLRTVAIAHGRAFGAGADLFAACDLRVATPETQWRFPGAAFGIVLGTRRLGEQVGVARALEWVSTGRRIDAPTALAHGLATALCERDALRDAVPALCVTRETYAALRRAARVDRRAVDMDALVRSASAPGLGRRIHRYREDLRARTSLNKETRK